MNKLPVIIEYAIEQGRQEKNEPNAFILDNPNPEFSFLFNHGFLKAVFGEGDDKTVNFRAKGGSLPRIARHWEYHAQQMVISKDPVDYVYQYVKGRK